MKDFKSKHIKRCEKILKYFNNPKFIRNYSFILGSELFKEFDRAIKYLKKFNQPELFNILLNKYRNNNFIITDNDKNIINNIIYNISKNNILYFTFLAITNINTQSNLDICINANSGFGYGDLFLLLRLFKNPKFNITILCPKWVYQATGKFINFNFKNIKFLTQNEQINKNNYNFNFDINEFFFNSIVKQTLLTTGYKRYISVNSDDVISLKKKLNKNYNIGISFSSDYSPSQWKNVSLRYFIPLTKIKGVQLYSLQYGKSDDIFKDYNIINLGKEFSDFYDTAVAIEAMDLIIAIDNVVMNIAGAMGKKTFAILNHKTHPLTNDKKPIRGYNTIEPFQNDKSDNWAKTMKKVEKEIKKLLKDKNL